MTGLALASLRHRSTASLATFLTVLLGTALMTLMFLSADSGHDEQASRYEENDDL